MSSSRTAGDEVLDVGGFEELQPAVLDVRDATGGQFDLEQVAVVRRTHQHCLGLEGPALLGGVKNGINHQPGFGRRVVTAHQAGPRAAVAVGAQPQLWSAGVGANRVGQCQDPLPGPEVLLQTYRSRGRQVGREFQQVPAVRAAEPVHGLGVVADHGQPDAVGTQQPDDVDLDLVDVLVLVDQNVIPTRRHGRAECRVGQQRPPAEQQVVEVQQRLRAFAGDVGPEQVQDRRRCAARTTGTVR